MHKSVKQYDVTTKIIHWLSALLVIGLFVLGKWMVELNYYSEWYKLAPHWHKSIGLCLFALTLFRIIWKQLSVAPKIEGKAWEIYVARMVHFCLYLLLLGVFISGYMISSADGRSIEIFNWFSVPSLGSFIENQEDIAGDIHHYLTAILIAFALLHALAALKHHFINKDNTLMKMLRVKQ